MGKVTTKLFDGLMAKYMAVFLHKPMPSMDFGYIGTILLLLVGFYLISTLFSYVQQSRWPACRRGIVYDMRKDVTPSSPACRSSTSTRRPMARS